MSFVSRRLLPRKIRRRASRRPQPHAILRALPSAFVVALLGVLGCLDDTNPCPPGLVVEPRQGRCVWPDASTPDTDADVPVDAGVDVPEPRCPSVETESWRALHESAELVTTIQTCSESGCTSSPCDVASCLADEASVTECRECVAHEALCATQRCPNACTRSSNEDCLACLCEAGCVERFESCAVASLGVCTNAFGRDAIDDELALSTPVVFRRKSATGFTRSTAFYADDPSRDDDRRSYAAIGHTLFVSFAFDGADFLLEHLRECDTHCAARISPVLRDGTLGRPAYLGQWPRGFDVVVPFRLDGAPHLFLYKSGRVPTALQPRGTAIVYRVEGEARAIQLVPLFEGAWTVPVEPAWTHVRAFAIEGATYLLQYRGGDAHEVQITRLWMDGSALHFTRVSHELVWEPDWHVVETFPIGTRWFVLQHARQRDGEEGGRVRVSALDHDSRGEPLPSLPILATTWPETTHVHPFRTPGGLYLLRRDEVSGRTDFVRLPTTPARWIDEPGEVMNTRSWGTAPPWDVVGVARPRLWEEP